MVKQSTRRGHEDESLESMLKRCVAARNGEILKHSQKDNQRIADIARRLDAHNRESRPLYAGDPEPRTFRADIQECPHRPTKTSFKARSECFQQTDLEYQGRCEFAEQISMLRSVANRAVMFYGPRLGTLWIRHKFGFRMENGWIYEFRSVGAEEVAKGFAMLDGVVLKVQMEKTWTEENGNYSVVKV